MKHVSLSKFDGSDKKKGCEIVECSCAFLTRNCCNEICCDTFSCWWFYCKEIRCCYCFMQKSWQYKKLLISLVESRHNIAVKTEWNVWLPKVLVFSFLFLDTFLVKEVCLTRIQQWKCMCWRVTNHKHNLLYTNT